MKKYFEKYKDYLTFIITNDNLVNITSLIERGRIRTLFYSFGIECLLILFEYYRDMEKYEECVKFRDCIRVMNKFEGKNLPETMEELILIKDKE